MEINISKENDLPKITLLGKLDTITSPALQEKLLAIIGEGNNTIIIDFENVDFISSAGLRVLLLALKKIKPLNGSLQLLSVSDNIKDVFKISGFTPLFDFK